MELSGKIKRQNIATGVWSLVANNGQVYELYNYPTEIRQDNLSVQITGQIREDIMTIAMIGPVLEVKSYQVLD